MTSFCPDAVTLVYAACDDHWRLRHVVVTHAYDQMLHAYVMLTQLVHGVLCQPKLLEYYMHLHCALGLSQGALVVAELCLASLRRIRCTLELCSAMSADANTQTNTQASLPYRQSWSRAPVCPCTFVYLFVT